jgi:hypothetical protein
MRRVALRQHHRRLVASRTDGNLDKYTGDTGHLRRLSGLPSQTGRIAICRQAASSAIIFRWCMGAVWRKD